MKYLYFLAISILIASCTESVSNQKAERTIEERMEDKLYPMEGYIMAQNYPQETFAIDAYKSALAGVKKEMTETSSRSGTWVNQGPGNIGGRINTIAVNPQNSAEMMLGYSYGGIFKSTDYGSTWNPIFDDEVISSISDITYDPNNSSIIYVGTGDHNISGYPTTGFGLYKSTDGGSSWNVSGLEDAGVISEIGISKSNSDIIYAASMGMPFARNDNRGLYKSSDAGDTWDLVFYLNDSTGVVDIEVHPDNPDIVYATTWTRIRNNRESTVESEESGIFKTTDGGQSWNRLTNGLPEGKLIRPGLAMFESDPDILYASFVHNYQDTLCSPGFQLEGIYKTTNAGESWEAIPTGEETGLPCNVLGGFGWYFGQIRVHPQNEDEIYILGVDLYNTHDGGQTWWEAAPPWWTFEVHADKHDLVFVDGEIILATDGGAYRRDPFLHEWTDIENIVSTQFYRIAVNPFNEDNYYGGAQDNGTSGGNIDFINSWPRIFGGDGFQMLFHPIDPDIWYVETQRGVIRMTFDGGYGYENATEGLYGTRNWDMQYIMSSVDPSILYTGTDRMFRSLSNLAPVWVEISGNLTDTTDLSTAVSHNISTLDESPVNPQILYCGTSDGLVWRSMNAGQSWDKINSGLPRRYISDIKASRSDEGTVYVTIQGYIDNDNTPYIYKSMDNGDSWTHINGDLPQIAINDILLPDTDDEDVEIFVGTDAGVYYTDNGGDNWKRLGEDMPIFPIYDLAMNSKNELIAGSFARGIYTYDLAQLTATNINEEADVSFKVYPTITTDRVTVSELDIDTKIQIISANGVLIDEIVSKGDHSIIDLSLYQSGVYFLKTENAATQRIIKI